MTQTTQEQKKPERETIQLISELDDDLVEWLDRIEGKLDLIIKSKCIKKPNGVAE